MPLIFTQDGFRVFFYSNEGDPREPVHVHVCKGGNEAKLWLEPTISIAASHGFNPRELSAILKIISARRSEIERKWHEHFSD